MTLPSVFSERSVQGKPGEFHILPCAPKNVPFKHKSHLQTDEFWRVPMIKVIVLAVHAASVFALLKAKPTPALGLH